MSHTHICGWCQTRTYDCECDLPNAHLLTCENCEERAKQVAGEIEQEERDSEY